MNDIFKTLIDPVTEKRLNSLYDFFFKKVFGEEGREELISYLIKFILEDSLIQEQNNVTGNDSFYNLDMINNDLKNLVFLNPHVNANTVNKKGSVMDVQVKTDKFIINIEAQVQKQASFGWRLFFYTSKMFSKSLNKGEDYTNLKRIISISILGYKLKNVQDYHDTGKCDLEKSPGMLFEDVAKFHIIQIPRLEENQYDLNNKLHRILILLDKDSSEECYTKAIEMDEVIEKMHNILDSTVKNEKEMEIYEMELKADWDYNSNINETTKKGREEAMITIAKKMKEIKRPVEEIAELTNISKEKIMSL